MRAGGAHGIAGVRATQHDSAMKVPPFKLDAWLAAHEFASPPIRYNLASSTGPIWTLAELMALGGGSEAALADVKLSYAPPQGSKLLRQRIASLHGVDPDHVLVMTGASEALIALTCLFAATRRVDRRATPGLSGGTGAGTRLGHAGPRIHVAAGLWFLPDRGGGVFGRR